MTTDRRLPSPDSQQDESRADRDALTLAARAGDIHVASVQDTGDAYETFQGWVLTCLWCRHEERGETKHKALLGMQRHYDTVCGKGRVIVHA